MNLTQFERWVKEHEDDAYLTIACYKGYHEYDALDLEESERLKVRELMHELLRVRREEWLPEKIDTLEIPDKYKEEVMGIVRRIREDAKC